MVTKRYRTGIYRTNLRIWLWSCAFLAAPVLLVAAATGMVRVLPYALVVTVVGALVALWRDRIPDIQYGMGSQGLILWRKGIERTIPVDQLLDASLIERPAARNYVRQVTQAADHSHRDARRAQDQLLRYCTVDIGLRSLSFGIGRTMIDRMPRSKDDLVLLRLRGGEQLLLSPLHPHDLIEHVTNTAQQHRRTVVT